MVSFDEELFDCEAVNRVLEVAWRDGWASHSTPWGNGEKLTDSFLTQCETLPLSSASHNGYATMLHMVVPIVHSMQLSNVRLENMRSPEQRQQYERLVRAEARSMVLLSVVERAPQVLLRGEIGESVKHQLTIAERVWIDMQELFK